MKKKFALLRAAACSVLTAMLVVSSCYSSLGTAVQRINSTSTTLVFSLYCDDLTLSEILDLLQSKTAYSFAYGLSLQNNPKEISLSIEKATVTDVLDVLGEEFNFSYRQDGQTFSLVAEKGDYEDQNNQADSTAIISGIVRDSDTDEALTGALVIIKGTSLGAITNTEGVFRLKAATTVQSLVISFIGYVSTEVPVKENKWIEISLKPDIKALDELLVVGYGTQERSDVTAGVAHIEMEAMNDYPVSSLDQALNGRLAGVQINENSGAPGRGAEINIRGISTLTAGKQPLIVLDGMPLSTSNSNINFINSYDIESVTVLKDAASASIYGSRGANGVILIKTKSGEPGKPKISMNYYTGWQEVTKKIEVLDAYQRAELIAEARNNSWMEQAPLTNRTDDPNSVRPPSLRVPEYFLPYLEGEKGLPDTDWQDEIFRKAPINNYELSVSGGNELMKYYVSGRYFDQEGIVINSGFRRFNFRTNLEGKLTDAISFDLHMAPTFAKSRLVSEDDHKGDGVIFSALLSNPAYSPYRDDGQLDISGPIEQAQLMGLAPIENPVALAQVPSNTFDRNRFTGGVALNAKLLEGLVGKAYFGSDLTFSRERSFKPSILGSYGAPAPTQSKGSNSTETNINWIFEGTANYKKEIRIHHAFNLLLGYSYQYESDEFSDGYGSDYPNDFIKTVNVALNTSASSFLTKRTLISYFSRINYSFKSKYLLTASLRRDGYSAFGAGNKWGVFPAVSAGWRLVEEPFLSHVTFLSELKLRGSWGVTGNNQIPDFGGLSLIETSNSVLDNEALPGFAPSTSPNNKLSWEETKTVDVGLDLGLFEGGIFFIADYYRSITDGLLLETPMPGHSGYTQSLQNIGSIQNSGWEAAITYQGRLGELKINSSVNFSTNKNKVLALGKGQQQITELMHITTLNEPIGSYFGYQVTGVFESEDQLEKLPHDSRAEVGSYIYRDVNGDGHISEKDRTIIGNFFPKYSFGASLGLNYQSFDLSIAVQGKQDYEIFNGMNFFLLNQEGWSNASRKLVGNYFVDGNGSSDFTYAKPRKSPTDKLYESSDLMVEDGSYVRLRNVTLGYSIPSRALSRIGIEQCRIYLSAMNPLIATKYSGYNPEVTSGNKSWNNSPTTPGVDYGAYPVAKSYIIGLNLKF